MPTGVTVYGVVRRPSNLRKVSSPRDAVVCRASPGGRHDTRSTLDESNLENVAKCVADVVDRDHNEDEDDR